MSELMNRDLMPGKCEEYRGKFQMLSHWLVEAQATERRHLARELHDEIGQSLTVMQLYLQQCYSRTAPTT